MAPAPATGNLIGTLQEITQQGKRQAPDYGFTTPSEVPPLFRATVTTFGPNAGRFSGEASTKQEAKKLAAAKALVGRS